MTVTHTVSRDSVAEHTWVLPLVYLGFAAVIITVTHTVSKDSGRGTYLGFAAGILRFRRCFNNGDTHCF